MIASRPLSEIQSAANHNDKVHPFNGLFSRTTWVAD